MFDLTGKIAVVTGGNGGIGFAMARAMAEAGASVIIVGRNRQKCDACVDALTTGGCEAGSIVKDVTNEWQVVELFEEVQETHGRVDILVNNAGTSIRKMPEDLTLDEWRQVMDINLTSMFLCCRAALPLMKEAGAGKIINIGSMLSIFGAPYASPYGASKGGVVQFTKSIATAWAVHDIQANAVLPGWIDTDLTQAARNEVPGLYDRVLARTPARRWGVPKDLGGIAVFLASSASDFVTGAAIPVDGGYSIA